MHIQMNRQDGRIFHIEVEDTGAGYAYVIYDQDDKVVERGASKYETADAAIGVGLRRAESL